jgi:hypothetical protein
MTRILSPDLEQYLHDHTRAQAPIFLGAGRDHAGEEALSGRRGR